MVRQSLVAVALLAPPGGRGFGFCAGRRLFGKPLGPLVGKPSGPPSRALPGSRPASSSSRPRFEARLVRGGGGGGGDGGSKSPPIDLSAVALPDSFAARADDVRVALASVLASCLATRRVQPAGGGEGSDEGVRTVSKEDASPVTVGDFASQACCLKILRDRHPADTLIAEEGGEALRADEKLLREVRAAIDRASEGWMDEDDVLRAVDYGRGVGSGSDRGRVWCLDPIDGTKGFLRGRVEGGQYCVALALIEDGSPALSVLGCPNLPARSSPATSSVPYGLWSEDEVREAEGDPSVAFSSKRGCLFVAVRGCGCYEIPLRVLEKCASGSVTSSEGYDDDDLAKDAWTRLHATPNEGSALPVSRAKFCLGVERGFSDPKGTVLKVAQMLHGPDALFTDADGIPDVKNAMRLDGQGKYGLLARGDAQCFLRLPREGYVDWVWDVAAGCLILEEAGGTMTDVRGRPIDFARIGLDRRAKLPDDVKGILGSSGGVFHDALVNACAEVGQ